MGAEGEGAHGRHERHEGVLRAACAPEIWGETQLVPTVGSVDGEADQKWLPGVI